MLFKPELKDDAKTAGKRVARGIGRRMVSLTVTLLILGGLGYLGWNARRDAATTSRCSRSFSLVWRIATSALSTSANAETTVLR